MENLAFIKSKQFLGYFMDRSSYTTQHAHQTSTLSKSKPFPWYSRTFKKKFAWPQLHGYVQTNSRSLWLLPKNLVASIAVQWAQKGAYHWRQNFYSETWSRLPRKRNFFDPKDRLSLKRAALCSPVIYCKAFLSWWLKIRF